MLKDWRKRSGKSRADLAAEVGVSDVSIWRIEEGKQTPSLPVAAKLEQITGIPAREFITDDRKPPEHKGVAA